MHTLPPQHPTEVHAIESSTHRLTCCCASFLSLFFCSSFNCLRDSCATCATPSSPAPRSSRTKGDFGSSSTSPSSASSSVSRRASSRRSSRSSSASTKRPKISKGTMSAPFSDLFAPALALLADSAATVVYDATHDKDTHKTLREKGEGSAEGVSQRTHMSHRNYGAVGVDGAIEHVQTERRRMMYKAHRSRFKHTMHTQYTTIRAVPGASA